MENKLPPRQKSTKRKNMCNFCDEKEKISECVLGPSLKMLLEGDEIRLEYDAYSVDSSFTEWIEIKFCPFCGEELRGRKPDDKGGKTTA